MNSGDPSIDMIRHPSFPASVRVLQSTMVNVPLMSALHFLRIDPSLGAGKKERPEKEDGQKLG